MKSCKFGVCEFCYCKSAWLWLKHEVISSKYRSVKSCKMCLVFTLFLRKLLTHEWNFENICRTDKDGYTKGLQWDYWFHVVLWTTAFLMCDLNSVKSSCGPAKGCVLQIMHPFGVTKYYNESKYDIKIHIPSVDTFQG